MLEKIDEHRLRKTSVFVLKLMLAGLIFRLVIFLDPDTYVLQSYLAELTKQVVNILGLNLERSGITLVGSEKSFIVVRDCLGWKSISVFIALVFASTRNILEQWKIILIGILILSAANLFRVISTVYLSYIGLISFDIIHSFLWRWGLTLTVLAIWYIWLRSLEL